MDARRRWIAGCLAATAVLAPAALAAGVPEKHAKPAKNVNACQGGVKIEPVADGSYDRVLNGVPVTITLDVDEAAQTYGFTSSAPITAARSKGGTGSVTVGFPGGATQEAGLHAPYNPRSGTVYGLSHVCFFSDLTPGEEPPPPSF